MKTPEPGQYFHKHFKNIFQIMRTTTAKNMGILKISPNLSIFGEWLVVIVDYATTFCP
jgi:hypothetical protein